MTGKKRGKKTGEKKEQERRRDTRKDWDTWEKTEVSQRDRYSRQKRSEGKNLMQPPWNNERTGSLKQSCIPLSERNAAPEEMTRISLLTTSSI